MNGDRMGRWLAFTEMPTVRHDLQPTRDRRGPSALPYQRITPRCALLPWVAEPRR